jgi:hypothetical protein
MPWHSPFEQSCICMVGGRWYMVGAVRHALHPKDGDNGCERKGFVCAAILLTLQVLSV